LNDTKITLSQNEINNRFPVGHMGGKESAIPIILAYAGAFGSPAADMMITKVCYISGYCQLSDVLAGVRDVTAHAGEIDVANLSLAGRINSRNEDAVKVHRDEIQRSVNAGAVYVAAAMNSHVPRDNICRDH
jgi:hypothetical protein